MSISKIIQGKLFVILNPASGLVLDATQNTVVGRQMTGFPAQLWFLEHFEFGRFFVTNKLSGQVLDIQKAGKKSVNIVVSERQTNNINQLWYINSDGSIVNANSDKFAIEIAKDNHAVTAAKLGDEHQHFVFQPH